MARRKLEGYVVTVEAKSKVYIKDIREVPANQYGCHKAYIVAGETRDIEKAILFEDRDQANGFIVNFSTQFDTWEIVNKYEPKPVVETTEEAPKVETKKAAPKKKAATQKKAPVKKSTAKKTSKKSTPKKAKVTKLPDGPDKPVSTKGTWEPVDMSKKLAQDTFVRVTLKDDTKYFGKFQDTHKDDADIMIFVHKNETTEIDITDVKDICTYRKAGK